MTPEAVTGFCALAGAFCGLSRVLGAHYLAIHVRPSTSALSICCQSDDQVRLVASMLGLPEPHEVRCEFSQWLDSTGFVNGLEISVSGRHRAIPSTAEVAS